MAQGFGDLFSYGLVIGILLFSFVGAIFDDAGIGPSYSYPSFTYNESSVITLVGGEDVTSSNTYENSGNVGSSGFTAIVDTFVKMLTGFSKLLAKFGIPSFICNVAQAFVWVVFGYEMLMLKRIIWG